MNETQSEQPQGSAGPVSKSNDDNAKTTMSRGGCLLRAATILILLGVIAYFVQAWIAQEVDPDRTKPVVINSKTNSPDQASEPKLNLPEGAITATINQKMIDDAKHPFVPLMKIAKLSIEEIDAKYQDYTTTLVSQVFVDDKLQEEKYIFCKIRHPEASVGSDPEQPQIPFSVYTKFLAPKASVGQEAIWIQGQNDGKIIAHPTGLLNIKRVPLDPEGPLAMDGNRYPIYEIGFRNLLVKMVELGEKDMAHGECNVEIKRNVEINGRVCTTLEASHPVKRDHFDFHIARIYIDDELNIPVAYEGFLWPEKAGEDPPLLERYIYTDIKLNVGLTSEDFDPGNKEYDFPAW